jgi:hypothetical protein
MQSLSRRNSRHSCAYSEHIVAYLLKARTVEEEKQSLLGNVRTQQERCHDTLRVQPLQCNARSIRMRGDIT